MTRNTAVLARVRAVELRATPRRVAAATTPPPSSSSGPRGRGVKISKFAVALGGAGDRIRPDEEVPTPPMSPWPCLQRRAVVQIGWP